MRPFYETVAGYAWTDDGSPTFDEALNAFAGRVLYEGGAITAVQHQAFMGPGENVVHAALVSYVADSQVSYQVAMEDMLGRQEDALAEIDFIREDSNEVLADTAEEEDE